ncbi:CBS domain-containing protein [Haloarcula onubensis]|uniref:CBS domain-containing protein n=1 Tax=Haloarcula onubensis TaxID=2950539 RepID=A0ABU2FTX5_9EURY|nr:CBS domain-containing protein [Halomicroarcula sp. S3CR25-11]MDS0284195.1 CBS domain-containing protein [Halomicroarcula sp. S3CR25-11]
MQVRELMSSDVVTVDVDAALADAVDRSLTAGVGSVIVVADGDPVGILTESDVLRAARDTGRPLREIDVRDVGHRPVVTTRPSAAVTTVARLMTDEGVKKVPVMDGVELVGIVTLSDIVWALPSLRTEQAAIEAVHDEWSPH